MGRRSTSLVFSQYAPCSAFAAGCDLGTAGSRPQNLDSSFDLAEMATSPARRRPRPPSPEIAAETLLDSLPPAMLDEILSRLPVRDAARTSVLSHAWRRRWESVPYPVLHWPSGTPAAPIDAVLARRTCPVSEFRHPYVPESEFCLSDPWLLRLANVGVQFLYLKFALFPMLHSCIFSCRQLTVLDLEFCDFPGPPSRFAGFPNLTTLSLHNVRFPQGFRGLEALISSSSSLQRLQLDNLITRHEYEQWVIHAPNLQHILISSEYDDFDCQIDDLPFLEVADIKIAEYTYGNQGLVNLISRLDQARTLHPIMPSSANSGLQGLSRSFVNLKSLSLSIPYYSLSCFLSLSYLLRNAPNLEVLDIELNDYNEEDGEVNINVLNAQWTDDLFSSLRSVHMKFVIWASNEMAFIEFVLSKARQLEIFNIHECQWRLELNEDAVAEVARYRRASKAAKVVISHMQ